ncbi:Oidioi.mRNA.OKI2018_I69.XSR.g15120.t1.cds [Oikopleura dioica]|uniref:Oidioi.mRNA.OKI2018_I69.XSR.g15120.t1.cds n=1 Tax=Oikopleura dioica TaxID=34765 RepID=A0ABN7SBU6_OIKDI|nr:Oidioi.mRNA.OKI2018_I69.XSR.g15120.t1.cds [Oikopleura dioica]
MNSEQILARIPKQKTGTMSNPNLYAVGVSKHGAIHFHLEIEGELYVTTLRVRSTAKSKNTRVIRCIHKKCLSVIAIKFPEYFTGPCLDHKSYWEFLRDNHNDLSDFKFILFNHYKHIHTCTPTKFDVKEYDLYPRPVDGDESTIRGTLTIPQFPKNPKRFDKWDYHPDAKRLRVHDEMTRGPTQEYVELEHQANNNDNLQQNFIDHAKVSGIPRSLEYTDTLTGEIQIKIFHPTASLEKSPESPKINDDTALTILVQESVKEEIKAEVKEEPVERILTENIIYDFQPTKTEIKEEPVLDEDEFDCFF